MSEGQESNNGANISGELYKNADLRKIQSKSTIKKKQLGHRAAAAKRTFNASIS